MSLLQILILAVIQGLAELLPVSSSAHVILAQHFMGLDPSAPEMTFLLVMLHTGTMFAAIFYFWRRWLEILRGPRAKAFVEHVVIATLCTGVLGLALKHIIEKNLGMGEVENLFRVLPLIGVSLFAAGILIFVSGMRKSSDSRGLDKLTKKDSVWIGLIQGLALPFRGLSRSGATISTALLRGVSREFAEEFSFALAVVLTPPVVVMQFWRLLKNQSTAENMSKAEAVQHVMGFLQSGLIGMALSCLAGLVALRWLSAWLEHGKWKFFGIYCFVAAAAVLTVARMHGLPF